MGGDPEKIYLIVRDIADIGGGLPLFIFGIVLLERFYCVFDATNKQVGFANNLFTGAKVNFNYSSIPIEV